MSISGCYLLTWSVIYRYVGELYFKIDRLRWSGTHQQSLAGFEKIRTVGKRYAKGCNNIIFKDTSSICHTYVLICRYKDSVKAT